MPKSVPQAKLDIIFDVVSNAVDGISIERINDALDHDVPRRTLQRRLALLVERGRLAASGSGQHRGITCLLS